MDQGVVLCELGQDYVAKQVEAAVADVSVTQFSIAENNRRAGRTHSIEITDLPATRHNLLLRLGKPSEQDRPRVFSIRAEKCFPQRGGGNAAGYLSAVVTAHAIGDQQ